MHTHTSSFFINVHSESILPGIIQWGTYRLARHRKERTSYFWGTNHILCVCLFTFIPLKSMPLMRRCFMCHCIVNALTHNQTKLWNKLQDNTGKKGMLVNNLEEILVSSPLEVFKLLQEAQKRRQIASTLMNKASSRSHAVFTVTIHLKEVDFACFPLKHQSSTGTSEFRFTIKLTYSNKGRWRRRCYQNG